MDLCPACGGPAFFGVADLCYESRELELKACCESNLDGWISAFVETDRHTRVEWML